LLRSKSTGIWNDTNGPGREFWNVNRGFFCASNG
jgi:hypothetical protein